MVLWRRKSVLDFGSWSDLTNHELVGSGQSRPSCCNPQCHFRSRPVRRDEYLGVEGGSGMGRETWAFELLLGTHAPVGWRCCGGKHSIWIHTWSSSKTAVQSHPTEERACWSLICCCFGDQNRTWKLFLRRCHGTKAVGCGRCVQEVYHCCGRMDGEAVARLLGWSGGATRWVCQY